VRASNLNEAVALITSTNLPYTVIRVHPIGSLMTAPADGSVLGHGDSKRDSGWPFAKLDATGRITPITTATEQLTYLCLSPTTKDTQSGTYSRLLQSAYTDLSDCVFDLAAWRRRAGALFTFLQGGGSTGGARAVLKSNEIVTATRIARVLAKRQFKDLTFQDFTALLALTSKISTFIRNHRIDGNHVQGKIQLNNQIIKAQIELQKTLNGVASARVIHLDKRQTAKVYQIQSLLNDRLESFVAKALVMKGTVTSAVTGVEYMGCDAGGYCSGLTLDGKDDECGKSLLEPSTPAKCLRESRPRTEIIDGSGCGSGSVLVTTRELKATLLCGDEEQELEVLAGNNKYNSNCTLTLQDGPRQKEILRYKPATKDNVYFNTRDMVESKAKDEKKEKGSLSLKDITWMIGITAGMILLLLYSPCIAWGILSRCRQRRGRRAVANAPQDAEDDDGAGIRLANVRKHLRARMIEEA